MTTVTSYLKNLKRNDPIRVSNFISIPKSTPATSYGYGNSVYGSDAFWIGGAALKRYLSYIDMGISANTAFTGDSNGAGLRITGSNYGAHDANYILRGINIGITNRSGGTMGRYENAIGVQNKSGGVTPTLLACTFTNENYGTNATESGVCDFINRNEANTATLSYGIRIRNDDRSAQAAVQSAIHVASHASSSGFGSLIDARLAVLTAAGNVVTLFYFKDSAGNARKVTYDTADAILDVTTV